MKKYEIQRDCEKKEAIYLYSALTPCKGQRKSKAKFELLHRIH